MTMRDQCIEAMAKAMAPDIWGEFRKELGSPANQQAAQRWAIKRATAAFDTLLEKLKSPSFDMKMVGAEAIPAETLRAMANYDAACDCWQAMLSTLSQEGK